jgi:hypothetical protein
MLFVLNWGTEGCSTGGLLVSYTLPSICVNAGSIDAVAVRGTTCGPCVPPTCAYTMLSTQTIAAILPVSSLPVSVSGVSDVVQNLP